MENENVPRITQKDYKFALALGLLMGLLLLPVLKAANPLLYSKLYIVIVPFFLIATPLGLRVAFFISKKIAIFYQFAKFAAIGFGNVLVDFGVLSFISMLFSSYLKIEAKDAMIGVITFYSLYKSISFIVANINSYFWNKYWTFKQDGEEKKETKSEFLQFFAVSIIGFLINVLVASVAFKIVLMSPTNLTDNQTGLIGAAAGSIAGLLWNFIGYKFWVFKK